MSKTSQELADLLIEHLDRYYSHAEMWDNELDRMLHEWYANAKNVFPKRPYFSPSAATACPRELYYKQLYGNKEKDHFAKPPYQGRWTSLGTAIGDMIQRDILVMERNMRDCLFRFAKNPDGTPMFEDFAKLNKQVKHDGYTFYLYGTTDGILEYIDPETGEIERVGLEIKSKQTTAARTSFYSMREPDEKHVAQCQMYGKMYGVKKFIIVYLNASKKSWVYPEGEYEKSPDIRAFGVDVDEQAQSEIFDHMVDVLKAVNDVDPPELDIESWTFNNFKTIIAKEITQREFERIKTEVFRVKRSNRPMYEKKPYITCLKFIESVRSDLI